MNKRVIVTGSAGFVGSHLVEHLLKNTDWSIIGIDKIDPYAFSNPERIDEVIRANPHFENRYRLIKWDLRNPLFYSWEIQRLQNVSAVFHLAASSHVDDSIKDPTGYCKDNVLGTLNVLEFARRCDGLEFIQNFGTDEVFGNAPDGVSYKEDDRYDPRNPYSAFKAGADHICNAYSVTYGLPILVSNCTNIIGEKQDCRKALPLFIKKILAGEKISIHCFPGKERPGLRQYVHARNVAAACLFLLDNRVFGKINLPGQAEIDNLQLAQLAARIIDKPLIYEMVDFHSNRPGHDTSYRLDGSKLASLGFKYPISFEQSIEKAIKWYLENPQWLN